MSLPPPVDNRREVGPFLVYRTGDFALPGRMYNLLELFARHFHNPQLLDLLEALPSRQRTRRPSLRMIEWLLTIESYNQPIYANGINLHGMYRSASELYGHTKETFDPNRRKVHNKPYRIWFKAQTGELVYSTVAAANFLMFCVQNGVLRYAVRNHDWISRNMINAVNARRKERRVAASTGKKAARQTFRQQQKRATATLRHHAGTT